MVGDARIDRVLADLKYRLVKKLDEEALEIALRHRITAYDACYVAASKQTRFPLITADEKLVMKLAKGSYDVQWLGDIEVALK